MKNTAQTMRIVIGTPDGRVIFHDSGEMVIEKVSGGVLDTVTIKGELLSMKKKQLMEKYIELQGRFNDLEERHRIININYDDIVKKLRESEDAEERCGHWFKEAQSLRESQKNFDYWKNKAEEVMAELSDTREQVQLANKSANSWLAKANEQQDANRTIIDQNTELRATLDRERTVHNRLVSEWYGMHRTIINLKNFNYTAHHQMCIDTLNEIQDLKRSISTTPCSERERERLRVRVMSEISILLHNALNGDRPENFDSFENFDVAESQQKLIDQAVRDLRELRTFTQQTAPPPESVKIVDLINKIVTNLAGPESANESPHNDLGQPRSI